MNSFGPGILRPTTLTMLSGLAIIVAATLALGSMAQDQSGQSSAMVSKSFRMEIGASDIEFPLISTASVASLNSATIQASLLRRPGTTLGQVKAITDPVQEFAFMLSELERVAGHCKANATMREVRIDVANAGFESTALMIKRACDLLENEEPALRRANLQVEIQTWATSPTPAAWLDAIRHASYLRETVHAELKETSLPNLLISSSAALWPYTDRVRPAMTIVLRFE